LGAIEAFSYYELIINSVQTLDDPAGGDLEAMQKLVSTYHPVPWYGIPNSQNPSGMTWSSDVRRDVADYLDGSGTLLYEDDAVGELFFDGRPRTPMKKWLLHQTVMAGSFSKTISQGFGAGGYGFLILCEE
jgi:2-aminoadipate transaminase